MGVGRLSSVDQGRWQEMLLSDCTSIAMEMIKWLNNRGQVEALSHQRQDEGNDNYQLNQGGSPGPDPERKTEIVKRTRHCYIKESKIAPVYCQ